MIKQFFLRLLKRIFCLHDTWEKCESTTLGWILAKNVWRCKRCGKKIELAPYDKPVGYEEEE